MGRRWNRREVWTHLNMNLDGRWTADCGRLTGGLEGTEPERGVFPGNFGDNGGFTSPAHAGD